MKTGLMIGVVVVFSAAAHAQPIAVEDAGFESSALAPCQFIQGFRAPAWSVDGNGGAWRPAGCSEITAPEGDHVAYTSAGVLTQTLADTAIPGATYVLSALIGARNDACCRFYATTLTLRAGAFTLGSRTILANEAPAPGTWARYSVTIHAPANLATGQPLVIRLSSGGAQTDFDSVRLQRGEGCPADFNADGFVDFFDFTAFVDCFEGVECPAGQTADFNGDGFPDFFDFQAYTEAFDAGC